MSYDERRFHNESDEPSAGRVITVPINDNQKYNLKDYRDKLYEEIQERKRGKFHKHDQFQQIDDSLLPSPPTNEKQFHDNPSIKKQPDRNPERNHEKHERNEKQ